jgi:NADH-quinone oxidoreductase subunit J
MIQTILFYIFAAITIAAAIGVIGARNPVHAALSLVLAFVASAGLWILLEAEFLGIVLVLVYVGAVMVLFLFVIMMLDINVALMRQGFARYAPLGALVTAVMATEISYVVWSRNFGVNVKVPAPHPSGYSNTKALGQVLYTHYVFPFEIASVILLVGIIAAIALTLRRRRAGTHRQDPARQVKVTQQGRVRLVNLSRERETQEEA